MKKTFKMVRLCAVSALVLSVCQQSYAQYCSSVYTNGCLFGININNFSTTGGQQNVSNLNSNCSGASANSTYAGGSIEQTQGQSINVSMSGPNQQGYKIWVDWNQDGDFLDTGEDVFTSAAFNQTSYTGSFTVPLTATPGSTTLRVRTNSFSYPTDPCASQPEGETEDYTFIVSTASADDAGIASIDTPTVGYCTLPSSLWITVENGGVSNLNTVDVNWEVNGVSQTPISYSGPAIPTNATSQSLFVGNYAFQVGDVIKVYTANPNGSTDGFNSNDTIIHTVLDLGLSGNYTIDPGGSGASNFNSFSSATAELQARGVCGAVTFSVADGLYLEQVLLENYPGMSATNNVTFSSASADTNLVEIRYSGSTGTSDNYVVGFANNASHFSFNNIAFQSGAGPVYAAVVNFIGANGDIAFNSCKFLNYPSFVTTNSSLIIQTGDSLFDVSFVDNTFRNGSFGALLSATTIANKNIVLDGNRFFDFLQAAAAIELTEDAVFSNNYITTNYQSTSVNGAIGIGVYLIDLSGDISVIGNHLIDPPSAHWSYIGFALENIAATQVNPALFRANRISMTTDGAVSAFARNVRAINCEHVLFEQNSFYLNSSATPTNYALQFLGGEGNVLLNNAFSTESASRIISVDSIVAIQESNYNAFYSDSAFGTFDINEYDSLANWQSAHGFDTNSIQTNSSFYADDQLLKVCDTALDAKGTDLTWFTNDYNGDPAVVGAFDIGADQFTSPLTFNLLDTTLFCSGESVLLELFDYDSVSWNASMVSSPTYSSSTEEQVTVYASGICGVVEDTTQLVLNDAVADFSYTLNGDSIDVVFTGQGLGTIDWNFGDGTIKTGSTSSHVYSGDGQYVVSCTITSSCGIDSSNSQIDVGANGYSEFEKLNVEVYPNPSKNYFNVSISNPELFRATLFDATGRSILEKVISGTTKIDLPSSVRKGHYTLMLKSSSKVVHQPILVQ